MLVARAFLRPVARINWGIPRRLACPFPSFFPALLAWVRVEPATWKFEPYFIPGSVDICLINYNSINSLPRSLAFWIAYCEGIWRDGKVFTFELPQSLVNFLSISITICPSAVLHNIFLSCTYWKCERSGVRYSARSGTTWLRFCPEKHDCCAMLAVVMSSTLSASSFISRYQYSVVGGGRAHTSIQDTF